MLKEVIRVDALVFKLSDIHKGKDHILVEMDGHVVRQSQS